MIAELEARALAAWPAAEVEALGGWRLRATSGVTRRANSAWTSGPTDDLARAIARSEAFYAERGLPAIFQICPASPPGLDEALAARGYATEAPVAILTAPLAELSAEAPAGARVRVDRELADDWFELSGGRGRFAEVQPVYRGILERIGASGGARAGYALASLDGEPAASALGVADGTWLGVFSVATLPPFRRRGAATALLRALARWGERLGARRAYLQVERDNRIAFELYQRDGFREAYGYHYRVEPGAA